MKERLKLVESFSELRAGMIVVYRGCTWCSGGNHRGILLSRTRQRLRTAEGGITDEQDVFRFEPDPHPDGTGMQLTALSVDRRKVFRVVDGLEDFDTQTSKRSLKKPQSLEKSR